MPVSDWSADPNQNGTISGTNIAENCPAANVNDAIRKIMANVRLMYDGLPNGSTFVTKTGAIFLDQPMFSGRGAFLHHNDPTLTSARVYVQAAGGSPPAGMVNGDFLIEV